jgi:hypothetical protein
MTDLENPWPSHRLASTQSQHQEGFLFQLSGLTAENLLQGVFGL